MAFNAIFMSPPYNKRFAHGNIFFLLVLLFPRSGEKNGNIRILYQIMGKQRGLKGGSKALYKAPKTKFKDNFKNFQSYIADVGFSKG